jgi:phosphatidylglycerol lysyltransferase
MLFSRRTRSAAHKAHPTAVSLLAVLTFGSGLVNLSWVLRPDMASRAQMLRLIFPVAFITLSHFVTLAAGIGLIVASFNIYKRKRLAYECVLVLATASIVFHMTKGLDYEEALVSCALLILLVANRRHFSVRSRRPTLRSAIAGVVGAGVLVTAYGTASFVAVLSVSYAAWCLFRPVAYRLSSLPSDRARAAAIVAIHGRATLDHHKVQPDKSLFFSPSGESFLAYRVAGAFAVVLGDPVGPSNDLPTTLLAFCDFCTVNDWGFALYQTSPDPLPAYRSLGFKTLKLGDDARVDLQQFDVKKTSKGVRSGVSKIERLGIEARWVEAPLDDDTVRQLTEVATDWQQIPGRRERHFALGQFNPDYVRSNPALIAVDRQGVAQAFVTVPPSYRRGEATLDLMRRRRDSPNGIMDFLIVKLLAKDRELGYETVSLGMVPMNGFAPSENPSPEERAIHDFFQRLNFVFSFKGLRAYKAKFATGWEPRYVIYRTDLDLARLAVAFARISEVST